MNNSLDKPKVSNLTKNLQQQGQLGQRGQLHPQDHSSEHLQEQQEHLQHQQEHQYGDMPNQEFSHPSASSSLSQFNNLNIHSLPNNPPSYQSISANSFQKMNSYSNSLYLPSTHNTPNIVGTSYSSNNSYKYSFPTHSVTNVHGHGVSQSQGGQMGQSVGHSGQNMGHSGQSGQNMGPHSFSHTSFGPGLSSSGPNIPFTGSMGSSSVGPSSGGHPSSSNVHPGSSSVGQNSGGPNSGGPSSSASNNIPFTGSGSFSGPGSFTANYLPDHYMTYHEFFHNLSSSSDDHLNIIDYPVNDLILMLSCLLTKIIEANDKLHPNHFDNTIAIRQKLKLGDDEDDEMKNKYLANVLAFHGTNIPGISLHAYLSRVLKYCPVTNEVFLSLLVYFDRIAKKANNLKKDKDQEQLFVMDSYNIHRLIISGITISSKFFLDIFYKNLRYAKVGGLPLEELNYLELQFLLLLDFKLMISVEDLQNYGDLLLRFWKREQITNQLINNDSIIDQNVG